MERTFLKGAENAYNRISRIHKV